MNLRYVKVALLMSVKRLVGLFKKKKSCGALPDTAKKHPLSDSGANAKSVLNSSNFILSQFPCCQFERSVRINVSNKRPYVRQGSWHAYIESRLK